MEKGRGGSEEGLFENPGNTSEVKRDIEGRWREAITGNLNNYSTQTKEKKNITEKKWREEKRKTGERLCP